MPALSVYSEIEDAVRRLETLAEAKNFRFAVAKSLTNLAQEVQAEVVKNMPNRFTLRRDWIQKGIRRIDAKLDKLEATVYSKDSIFMDIQESGGAKGPRLRKYLAVPTKLVRRTPKDIIRRADKPKSLLSAKRASFIEYRGKTWLALNKTRKGKNDVGLYLMYLMIPVAKIKPRLGLNDDGNRLAKTRFTELLKTNLEAAVNNPKRS